MVRKTEEKKEEKLFVKIEDGENPPLIVEAFDPMAEIDYEELCIQLKAATGEITRLEDKLTKTEDFLLNKDTLHKEGQERNADLRKQLDQEVANANKIIDLSDENEMLKIKLNQRLAPSQLEEQLEIKIERLEADLEVASFIDKNEQIKLLEEKLALCDEFYKTLQGRFMAIKVITDDPFKEKLLPISSDSLL